MYTYTHAHTYIYVPTTQCKANKPTATSRLPLLLSHKYLLRHTHSAPKTQKHVRYGVAKEYTLRGQHCPEP